MKKQRFIIFTLALVMLFSLAVPNYALDKRLLTGERVNDAVGIISVDEYNLLLENSQVIYDEYGVDVLFCFIDSNEIEFDFDNEKLIGDYLIENGYWSEDAEVSNDLVLFVMDFGISEYEYWTNGKGDIVFSEEQEELIYEELIANLNDEKYYDAFYLIQDFIYGNCQELLNTVDKNKDTNKFQENDKTKDVAISGFEAAKAARTIPNERYAPRLVDTADLLTDSQESKLLKQLDEISEKTNFDVVIALVDDIDGYDDITPFADDYFDYNGFGMGSDRDGILFTIDVERRKWAISTHGFGLEAFADDSQEYIMDRVLPSLKNDEYYEGVETFVNMADKFIVAARDGKPYTGKRLKKLGKSWAYPLKFAIPIGMVISALIISFQILTRKTVNKENLANEYAVEGSLNITKSSDRFIYRHITKRVIEKDDDSGSSSHTSSSGSSHGGSSGDF